MESIQQGGTRHNFNRRDIFILTYPLMRINCYFRPLKTFCSETAMSNLFSTLPEIVQAYKAIGDRTRLRILALLTAGELCVCDIMAALELPQSTASRHLAYLKNSNWIIGIRCGKWMHYRLHPNLKRTSVHSAILDHITEFPESRSDRQKLVDYLKGKDLQPSGK